MSPISNLHFPSSLSSRRTSTPVEDKLSASDIVPTSRATAQSSAARVEKLIAIFRKFGHPNFSLEDLGSELKKQRDDSSELMIYDNNRWYKYQLTKAPSGIRMKELFQHHEFNLCLSSIVIDVTFDDIHQALNIAAEANRHANELFGESDKEIERDFAALFSMHADMMATIAQDDQNAKFYLEANAEKKQLLEDMFPLETANGQDKFADYTIRCANLSSECGDNVELSAQYKHALVIVTNLYMALREVHC